MDRPGGPGAAFIQISEQLIEIRVKSFRLGDRRKGRTPVDGKQAPGQERTHSRSAKGEIMMMPRPGAVAHPELNARSREGQPARPARYHMRFAAHTKIDIAGVDILQSIISVKMLVNPGRTTLVAAPMQESQSIKVIHARNIQKHAQNVHCGKSVMNLERPQSLPKTGPLFFLFFCLILSEKNVSFY